MITEIKCSCGVITPQDQVGRRVSLTEKDNIVYWDFTCICGQDYLFKQSEPIIMEQ